MTKVFLQKLLVHGSIDTRKYRYRAVDFGPTIEIRRILLEHLDTTAAYTEWETIKVIKLY